MTDKATRTLRIPDATLTVLVARGYNAFPDAPDESVRRDLQLIAAPIVAAELRRMAARLDESDDARKLLARADELDVGA